MPSTWKVFDARSDTLTFVCEDKTREKALLAARRDIQTGDLVLVKGKTAEMVRASRSNMLYIVPILLFLLLLWPNQKAMSSFIAPCIRNLNISSVVGSWYTSFYDWLGYVYDMRGVGRAVWRDIMC